MIKIRIQIMRILERSCDVPAKFFNVSKGAVNAAEQQFCWFLERFVKSFCGWFQNLIC